MLNVEQWAEIRRLHFIEEVGIRELANPQHLGGRPDSFVPDGLHERCLELGCKGM